MTALLWLVAAQPHSADRVYAAYGGVYIPVALVSFWLINGVPPGRCDLISVTLSLGGLVIIYFAPRASSVSSSNRLDSAHQPLHR